MVEHHVVGLWKQRRVALAERRGACLLFSVFPTGEVRGAVATHRDARVLVEQHLQQVRRQEGRMFELLLSSDHVGVLLVRTGGGAGHVWWEKKPSTGQRSHQHPLHLTGTS